MYLQSTWQLMQPFLDPGVLYDDLGIHLMLRNSLSY